MKNIPKSVRQKEVAVIDALQRFDFMGTDAFTEAKKSILVGAGIDLKEDPVAGAPNDDLSKARRGIIEKLIGIIDKNLGGLELVEK